MDKERKKKYLRKGRYLVLDGRFIFPFSLTYLSSYKRLIIKSLRERNVSLINIKTDNRQAMIGDKIIYRKLDKGFLLFDSIDRVIYRKYTDSNQVKNIRKGMSTLEAFYDVNKIDFISEDISKEEYLHGKTLRNVTEEEQLKVFEKIINKYYENLKKENYPRLAPRISSSEFFKKLESTVYPEEMKKILFKHEERVKELVDNFIWTWSHSDLTPDNIIVEGEDHYIIDIERCEPMPVLYDLVNLIFTMIQMCDCFEPYLKFLRGYHDYLLKKSLRISSLQKWERELILLIMLSLKSIVSWDSELKKDAKETHENRWFALKDEIDLKFN